MGTRYRFEIASTYAPLLLAWGVTDRRAYVDVGPDRLVARFGFFRAEVPLSDIHNATVHEGPFKPLRAIGVRYSFEDRSATFGSNTGPMIELDLRRPVTVRPPGLTRHPSLWLSVADPHGLVDLLTQDEGPDG